MNFRLLLLSWCSALFLPLTCLAASAPALEETVEVEAVEEETAKEEAESEAVEPEEDDPLAGEKAELAELEMERDLLQARNAIAEARLVEELAEQKAELERRKTGLEEASQALLEVNDLAKLKAELEQVQLEAQISKARMDQRVQDLRVIEEELKSTVAQLRYEIEEKEKVKERDNYADQEPVYLADPLQGDVLVISDRRIALNGVISMQTAEHLVERINYFNNKTTEFPIFIVIDDSPGGSVMAGYRILKAMESSEAPVFVVVQSYAASMAAVITAMAERSFAYPNAILLQHQLAGFFMGNVTQQREDLEETEEWWRRLAQPVAQKMGITLEEFVKQMYSAKSTGDWDEFADRAQELKWIDTLVAEIRETSLLKNPDAEKSASSLTTPMPKAEAVPDEAGMIHTFDEAGRPIGLLPRINSHDRWWLYNPDGYFRVR